MNLHEIYSVLSFTIILLCYETNSWYPFLDRSKDFKAEDTTESLSAVKAAGCKISDLKIIECGIKVSRLGNQRTRAEYKKFCTLREASFVFYFGKDGAYSLSIDKKKPQLSVSEMKKLLEKKKKKFLPGSNYIYVEMNAKSLKNAELTLKSDKCTFFVNHEKPTPNLGRVNRKVVEGRSFIVSAAASKNNDLEEKNVGLNYKWSCTDSVGFCEGRDLGTKSTVTVDQKYATAGAKFTFNVGVRTSYSEWQNATQFIGVNDSMPYAINCIGRCGKDPNTLNPLSSSMLLAHCQFHCNVYNDAKVDGRLIYINRTERDVSIPRISQGPKVIPSVAPSARLKVIAYYENNLKNIIGEQEFTTYPIPRLEKCKSIPPSGTSLTKFKIECSYDKDKVENFEIEVKSQRTVVFSATSEKLEDIEYMIPKDSTVTVTLRDKNFVLIKQKMNVKINPLLASTNNVSEVNEHLTDILDGKAKGSVNVDDALADGNYANVVQIIDVVARELENVPVKTEEDKELVKNLKEKLLNSLSKLPVNDFDMTKSVSGVVSLLANLQKDTVSESGMAKQLGEICSKVAKSQLDLMENDSGGDVQEKDVIDITNNLLSCGESEAAPNYAIFDEMLINIEVKTEYPVIDDLSENNIEDYPEYQADDLLEVKMSDFIEAAEFVMSICRDMGASLILATSLYNDFPTYIERQDTAVGVFKSTGMKVAGTVFKQHDVSVRVSTFFETIDSIFSVQLCTYKNDPFWSASKTFKIDTNVVDMSITDMSEEIEIKKFGTEPMNISFGVTSDQLAKKITKNVVLPSNRMSQYPEDNFIIFIFMTKGNEPFFIEFHDLDKFHNIDAVLLDMERPTLHNFSKASLITKENNKLFMENQVDEDKWFLLGIMLKINSLKKDVARFTISVYTIKCITWDSSNSSWKTTCSIYETTTTEVIHCRCLHLSTLAGSLQYNNIKEHPKFYDLEFILEERKSFLIYITVCMSVILYFLLLIYATQQDETKEDAVYFLSDVPSQNRYCYLISIRTGKKVDAGTTADIVIQLFGTRGKSQEHVLNFPDPFLELLQRNQKDLFVLATPNYLGKLLKIHLWFDCTGNSPNWYCEQVEICDLQKRKWFLFNVQKWLRVDGKPTLFLDVAVVSRKSKSSRGKVVKNKLFGMILSIGQFQNTLWSTHVTGGNPNLGVSKRITLILSIFLTLMVVLILFYGKPEMVARDSITPKCYFEINMNMLYVGIYSAIITFLPHILLMEGFKKSRQQFDVSDPKTLPFIFTVIIWVIVIINVFVQIHVLLIYGFWIIPPTSWEWTASLIIALLFYVFLLDYTFHIVLQSAEAVIRNGKMNYDKILKNIEQQRHYLYAYFGENICRPVLTPLYQVMGRAEYLKKYFFFRQKREVLWQIQDLMMITMFIFFLYMIIMEERDTIFDVLCYDEILNLVTGYQSLGLKLKRVNKMDEFENYMERTFIPTLQSLQWYGRYVAQSPGLTTDACNRYLGIVRMRQHRAEYIPCNLTSTMKFINRTCTATRYFTQFDYLNYTPSWSETTPEFHRSRLGYVWGYQKSYGEGHFGVAGRYKKGGYIALLGRNMRNSLVNFDYLRRHGWMNVLTRAIFIEFALYNVNMNLFNFATVILEKTPSGYIHKDVMIKPVRIMMGKSESTLFSMSCSVLFMILVSIITIRIVLRIIKTKVWYKRDLWYFVDIGLIFLSITWIVMFFRRFTILEYFIKELEESQSNNFINYFRLIGVESWMLVLASILIGGITLRIWRLLRFAHVFRIVERTLVYSFEPLIYCCLYFIIYCIGFGVAGFVLFSTSSDNFKDSTSTVKTLILMTIGLRGPTTLRIDEKETVLGYVFIILFYLISYFVTTIFVAIILVNFIKAQQFSFDETSDYNMKDYTKDKIIDIKRTTRMLVRKFRLNAGAEKNDDEEMVTPKTNDIRYMNCVSVDSIKMRAMKSVVKCVLLKKKKELMVDKNDHALMLKSVRNLFSKEKGEDEFFFKQYTKSEGCKLVENRRLLMMEEIVKRMLESPIRRAERIKKIQEREFLRAENLAKLEMMNFRLQSMLKVIEDISVQLAPK